MALINHRAREIHFKIVYVGPGLSGKTTNLQMLHDRLPPERRGRLVSISTDHERTLFFDFLPIDLGHVNGFLTRFHLYTVPGQVYYRLSRRAVLQGLDGIVFVADSHPAREKANRDSLEDTHTHLGSVGMDDLQIARLPWIVQYNKRDVVSALPIERLRAALNPGSALEFEAMAREGRGVAETLRAACKSVLGRLTREVTEARSHAPGVGAGEAARATATAAVGPAGAGSTSSDSAAGTPAPRATGGNAPRGPQHALDGAGVGPFGPASFGPPVARPILPPPRIATAPRRYNRGVTRA
jgi:signal recognition particle receptor subunit beta